MINNKSVLTKEKNLTFNNDIYRLRMPNPFLWGIVSGAMGVILIIVSLLVERFLPVAMCLGVCLILFAILLLFLPKVLAYNANKVFAENAKGMETMIFNFRFYEQSLEIYNEEGVVLADGDYENISQVIETEQAFYLMTEPYFGFVVDKDGFLDGDSDQLRELLKTNVAKYSVLNFKSKTI